MSPDRQDLVPRLNNRVLLKNRWFSAVLILFYFECSPALLFTAFQGEYAEAGVLYERCQAILQKAFGPEHPFVAEMLDTRGALLKAQV